MELQRLRGRKRSNLIRREASDRIQEEWPHWMRHDQFNDGEKGNALTGGSGEIVANSEVVSASVEMLRDPEFGLASPS